jgi:hypothetical protein
MFWGPKNADTFSTYVNENTIASQGIKHVLGMNEQVNLRSFCYNSL